MILKEYLRERKELVDARLAQLLHTDVEPFENLYKSMNYSLMAGGKRIRPILLLAVIEKRAGYFLGTLDVYLNIVGGLRLDETACDLAVVLAVASSLLDKPIPDDTVAIGEVGLGGEIRSVSNLDLRLREAARIGFARVILPRHSLGGLDAQAYPGLKLAGAATVREAIGML